MERARASSRQQFHLIHLFDMIPHPHKVTALETRYKGCRFRSRLEARWAVFFEAAGIRWSYEPQGYRVGSKCYLPDFYLPDFESFFEVKGEVPLGEQDVLWRNFSIGIDQRLIVAVGDIPTGGDWYEGWPGFQTHIPQRKHHQDEHLAWGYDVFLRCWGCNKVNYMNKVYTSCRDVCCPGERVMPLQEEFEKARSARFEHGEHG